MELQKYAPGQARDEAGRFASDGRVSTFFARPSGKKNAEVASRIGPSEHSEGYFSAYAKSWAEYTLPDGRKIAVEYDQYKPEGELELPLSVSAKGSSELGRVNQIIRAQAGGLDMDSDTAGLMIAVQKKPGDPFVIDAIVVEEDYRRQGIATAMLELTRRDSGETIKHSSKTTPDGSHFVTMIKYAPGQARDDHGRFASGGGVGGPGVSVSRPSKTSPIAQAVRARILDRDSSAIVRLRAEGKFNDDDPAQLAEAIQAEEMANADKAIRDLARDLGHPNEKALREGAAEALGEYVAEGKIAIQMKSSNYERFADTGKFKTLHDGGNPSGSDDVAMRVEMEESWFGPGLHPAYGYVRPVDTDAARVPDVEQYGEITLILKDSVKARTTVITGDSLGYSAGPVPTSAVKPDEYGFDFGELSGDFSNKAETKAAAREVLDRLQVDYVEAQIHGGISMDDVEMVLIDGKPAFQKYAPGQARDQNGRFAGGGGGVSMRAESNLSVSVAAYDEKSGAKVQATLVEALGAIGEVHEVPDISKLDVVAVDKKSAKTMVGQSDVLGWYTPQIPGKLHVNTDLPVDPLTTVVHEFGHMVDHEQLGWKDPGEIARPLSLYSAGDENIGKILDLGHNAPSARRYRETASDYMASYVSSNTEIFARAYTQWVATRSSNPRLLDVLKADIARDPSEGWTDEEFVPIGLAMDSLFRERGLLNESVTKYAPGQARDRNGRFAGGGSVASAPKTLSEYQGLHTAPYNDGFNMPLGRATEIYPEDLLKPTAVRWYGSGHEDDPLAVGIMQGAVAAKRAGRPAPKVKVYRAVPTEAAKAGATINPGDWVTPSRTYAREHGDSNLNGDYRLVDAVISTDELYTDANSFLEWGYDPTPTEHDGWTEELLKYAPGQARDDNGRFASGGGTVNLAGVATAISKVHDTMEIPNPTVRIVQDELAPGVGGDYHYASREIRVKATSTTPELIFAHELGHHIDRTVFGRGDYSGTQITQGPGGPMKEILGEMKSTPEYQAWVNSPNGRYYASKTEMFARGYAQWVAIRSGDPTLVEQLAKRTDTWTTESFEPIAAAYDTLFTDKGLIK